MKAKDLEKVTAILERIAKIEAARATLYQHRGSNEPMFAINGLNVSASTLDDGKGLSYYLTGPALKRVAHAIDMELFGIVGNLVLDLKEIGVTDAVIAPLRPNPELSRAEKAA